MLVSIVAPTHNRPEMLAEALASVRAQTFADYEIIVVSNGESDDMRRASHDIAKAYGGRYFELAEGNVSAARNFGIERAKGEWIAFLDDDDLWLPTKLERQIAEAQRTGADMIACDYATFFPDGRESIQRIRPPDGWSYVKAISRQRWRAVPSAVMVRKIVFEQVGNFDQSQRYGEDNDMWRRISWRHTIHQMDDALVRYRSGHQSAMLYLRQHEWELLVSELRHHMKMRRDTPHDLRSALPPTLSFVRSRLVGFIRRGLRPRTRWWRAFRQRLKRSPAQQSA
jgi:glycosyltransferase involved in cell wall biosynthesis